MFMRRLLLVLVIGVSASSANAFQKVALPSNPTTWGDALVRFIQPTSACEGGTVEQLRTRMAVSEPYSAAAFEQTHGEKMDLKYELEAADRIHLFGYRWATHGQRYRGFEGYLVVRRGCVIHAEITRYHN